MKLLVITQKEIKLGFRNPWAYSFLALFSFFSLALLLIQSQMNIQGYTHTTATMINLILYLLPLMTLLLGSFSVTAEKEEGGWQLLSTYSLSSAELLWGKFFGLAVVLLTIVGFGYGFSGLLGWFTGKGFSTSAFTFLFSFSVLLILLFLSIALWIGAVSSNRWQALTIGVGIWFLFILGWPTILIAMLGFVPYLWIKPLMEILTFLNPAEFVRIFMVMKIGGGSVFGPEYYQWITWIGRPSGSIVFILGCLLWIIGVMGMTIYVWERGRHRG